MLKQVAEGVLVHQSELLQNNTVVVEGTDGVLLVDAGVTGDEMLCLANDLAKFGRPVIAGFSTHPDWDHVLWHAELGEAPRYGTARCAAEMAELLSGADWKTHITEGLPPEIAEETPWTCSASSRLCLPGRYGSLGTAPKSGSSNTRVTPPATRRC